MNVRSSAFGKVHENRLGITITIRRCKIKPINAVFKSCGKRVKALAAPYARAE